MNRAAIPAERIERSILFLRRHKVLLDADLAVLYGVETRVLVQAVKRKPGRFPDDFMFQLDADERAALRSQSVLRQAKLGAGGKETTDVDLKLADGALAVVSARRRLSQSTGSESCVCLG